MVIKMKIIYKNTFDNTLTEKYDKNFPREDQFFANQNIAVVADGITRDPVGIAFDEAAKDFNEAVKHYPRPSGAMLAAKEVTDTFQNNFMGNLSEAMILANENIRKLNEKYIPKCDYLQNDFYGTVASAAFIENHLLHYSYICDCGVIVYDKNGNIIFQTEDEFEKNTRPFLNQIPYPWTDDQARIITRRDYRNNLNMIHDGKCVSYGALTGEKSAESFIREGTFHLHEGDTVIVYSDGLFHFLHNPEFIQLILHFDKLPFENFINQKAQENYSLYGKEKTLIIIKED